MDNLNALKVMEEVIDGTSLSNEMKKNLADQYMARFRYCETKKDILKAKCRIQGALDLLWHANMLSFAEYKTLYIGAG